MGNFVELLHDAKVAFEVAENTDARSSSFLPSIQIGSGRICPVNSSRKKRQRTASDKTEQVLLQAASSFKIRTRERKKKEGKTRDRCTHCKNRLEARRFDILSREVDRRK